MPNSPERLVRTMWGPAVEQRHDVDAGRRHNVAWLWRWFARTSQKFLGDLSGAFFILALFSLLFHLLSLKRIWPLCLESWSCR